MTEITPPAHAGRFANQHAGLYDKLVEVVADRESLPINGKVRPAFFRSKAEQFTNAILDAFKRDRDTSADPEILSILQAMRDNYHAWQESRQANADERTRLDAERIAIAKAAQAPTHYTLRFTDANTGRMVEITLPADQVWFVGEVAA